MGRYRQQLLEATRQLVQEKGVYEFSMRDLIKTTGLSPGTLYREFANKDDLLLLGGAENLRLHWLGLEQAESLGLNGAELMLYLIGFAPYISDFIDYDSGDGFLPNNNDLASRATPEALEELKTFFSQYRLQVESLAQSLIDEGRLNNSKVEVMEVMVDLMILCRGNRIMRVMRSNIRFRPSFVTTEKLCQLGELVLGQLDWNIDRPLLRPKKLELTWKTIMDQRSHL